MDYSNTGWTPTKSKLYRKLLIRRVLRRIWNFCKRNTENGLIFGVAGVFGFALNILFHHYYGN